VSTQLAGDPPFAAVGEDALTRPGRVPTLPNWPAGMSRELALAYTGVASAQLRQWEREGVVRFVARGPRGAKIALRSDLDSALTTLFSLIAGDGADFDFDFG
jgi:hypothetical protein